MGHRTASIEQVSSRSRQSIAAVLLTFPFAQSSPPTLYPEYATPGSKEYVHGELDYWTSGFFSGSLYLLLERAEKYPLSLNRGLYEGLEMRPHVVQLK
jgi:hypothetical protein